MGGKSSRRNTEPILQHIEENFHDETITNLEKLRSILEQYKKIDPNETRKYAVLVATGSFCPIHKMHIKMFELAKSKLEENDEYYVVAGFLSPSSDIHVQSKLGQMYISEYHRVTMGHLVVKDYDWITVSEWECRQNFFC